MSGAHSTKTPSPLCSQHENPRPPCAGPRKPPSLSCCLARDSTKTPVPLVRPHVRRGYRVVPVYTGDVSGACSALFELGGMVVIHDPSGCNSTYNTHDETRWYDQDSLVFISGLTDVDAIVGNDDRLVEDVVSTAQAEGPAFITLVGSPVPFLEGTDLSALARIIEARSGIPTRFVPTNGMHDYVRGAGRAFEALAELVVGRDARSPHAPGRRVNVLGMTPLDFAAPTSASSLRSWLEGAGFEPWGCWALGDMLAGIARAAEADVSLVVSATGLRVARWLERWHGVPYAAGIPTGAFADVLRADLMQAIADGTSRVTCRDTRMASAGDGRSDPSAGGTAFVGEAVVMGSLAAALALEGRPTRLVCPLEDSKALLAPTDDAARGETEVERSLLGAHGVVADPFFGPVCPVGATLHGLPQLALSGRQWLNDIPDLFQLDPIRLTSGPCEGS